MQHHKFINSKCEMVSHFYGVWNFLWFLPLIFLSTLLLPSNWRWCGLEGGVGKGVFREREVRDASHFTLIRTSPLPHFWSLPSRLHSTNHWIFNLINFQFDGLWCIGGAISFTRLENFYVFWVIFYSLPWRNIIFMLLWGVSFHLLNT